MHSSFHIINELNKSSNFKQCTAVEKGNIICFNKIVSKGLCDKHRQRMRNTGTIDLVKKEKKCKFIDCHKSHRAKGFCEQHYKKYIKSNKYCSVSGCSIKIVARNLCKKHYQRVIKYGDINGKSDYKPDINKNLKECNKKRYVHSRKNIQCIAPGCLHDYKSSTIRKGLCRNHYYKWHKYGAYR